MIPEKARARDIILRHGWNSTVYQLLNPGIDYWFSGEHDAVVGYVRKAGVRVVAGAPVTPPQALEEVARAFEAEAGKAGESVCYFCAEARLEAIYRDREGYAQMVLGGQPVWDPRGWDDIIATQRSLRAQLNRARNKGVVVTEWPGARARQHPDLEALLESWLARKPLPSLHFLVEPHTLSELRDRRVFVAQQDERLVGFLVASPIPGRQGWLVEQVIRHHEAPNGTSELLIDAAARGAACEGRSYFTLGLVPLAERFLDGMPSDPLWLRWTLRWMRAHGQRFYNFSGLEYFKSKFKPQHWDPVFAVTNEASFSVRTLYAIAAAFGGGSPIGLLASALSKAARQELRWQWQRQGR